MGDVLQHTRDAIEIFNGDLIIGNHDSITLFGTQSQVNCRKESIGSGKNRKIARTESRCRP